MELRFSKAVFIAALALVVVAGLLPVQSQALTFYSSRALMPSNRYVDWIFFGPVDTTVLNGATTFSNNHEISVTVTNPTPGDLSVLREKSSSFHGNFALGDSLLFSNDINNYGTWNSGPIDIGFDQDVQAAGAQMQRNYYGNFTAYIEAFDAGNTSLGKFSLAGNSNGNNDNSAIFLGVYDPNGKIRSIEFSYTELPGYTGGFTINRLDLQRELNAPLPGSLLLLGSALVGLAGLRLRKR
jgi:hypothetical protein